MGTGDRIAERRAAIGLSQTQLAKAAGVSQGTIGKLESGISSGSSHLHKIARELQTTPEYLLGETDDPSLGFIPAPKLETVAEELGLVPIRELDLAFGMGATFLDIPVTESVRHFPSDWLRQYSKAPPEKLVFAQGAGDSMFPTLLDSDTLLIDCSQQVMTMSDQIWALGYCGLGMIKRLRPTRDGGLRLLSDNHAVPEQTAYDGEVQLIGRVVAIVRKM